MAAGYVTLASSTQQVCETNFTRPRAKARRSKGEAGGRFVCGSACEAGGVTSHCKWQLVSESAHAKF